MKRWIWAALVLGLLAFSGGATNVVTRLGDAIAYAEGFYTPGSRPRRNNNPGDVTYDFGLPVLGHDGPFPIFATVEDGWEALYRQIEMMLDGRSSYYNRAMNLAEIAAKYTATEAASWAANVASRLGVSVDTTLDELGG